VQPNFRVAWPIAGAIFDVDDTLLDNHPGGDMYGLHERTRLEAAHTVGRRHGIAGLTQLTPKQATDAFIQAPVHTIQGAVWQMLIMAGVVANGPLESDHPLLQEIIELKEHRHEHLLRTEGHEAAGATKFVETLTTTYGLRGKLAIASTASRRDVNLFLQTSGLQRFFPEANIISREQLVHAKPHPDAYNQAFATLELPEAARARVWAFEDDPRGVMSAKTAGLFTCALATTRFTPGQLMSAATPPDIAVGSFAELQALLAQLSAESAPPATPRAASPDKNQTPSPPKPSKPRPSA